jgi:beta-RFAP synthase
VSLDRSGDPAGTRARALQDDGIPPILIRCSVPKDWRFIIAIPGTGQGISGESENNAFAHMSRANPEAAEKVSRLLLMKMLPALVEKDIVSFGQALTQIQRIVGDCFAEVQGGRYSNPLSEQLIELLLQKGAVGAGQSSWGPAVYGLVAGKALARQVTKDVRAFLDNLGTGQVLCVQPRNRGAQIRGFEHGERSRPAK